MAVLRETFDEIGDSKLDSSVAHHIGCKGIQCGAVGKAVEEEKVGRFQKRTVRSEVFNPDPAILENAGLSVHIADLRPRRRHSGETRHEIVWHTPPSVSNDSDSLPVNVRLQMHTPLRVANLPTVRHTFRCCEYRDTPQKTDYRDDGGFGRLCPRHGSPPDGPSATMASRLNWRFRSARWP